MKIKLPIIKKELIDGEVVKKRSDLEVDIDTSFRAHLKWEEHFLETMKYDLTTYTEMVKKWLEDENSAKVKLLSILKLLYCYVNSDKLPTFKEFCSLFDYEVATEILQKIADVLEQVGKVASKN